MMHVRKWCRNYATHSTTVCVRPHTKSGASMQWCTFTHDATTADFFFMVSHTSGACGGGVGEGFGQRWLVDEGNGAQMCAPSKKRNENS